MILQILAWSTAILLSIYCFWDSKSRRMNNSWLWAASCIFIAIIAGPFFSFFVLALLKGNRKLKTGEKRLGGRAWNSCRLISTYSTVIISLCAVGLLVYYSLPNPIFVSRPGWLMESIAADYARRLGALFLLWLLFAVVPFILGLTLKKDVAEEGLEDPL
jgi:hypothetical protein